jgi:hypothetical protein
LAIVAVEVCELDFLAFDANPTAICEGFVELLAACDFADDTESRDTCHAVSVTIP